MSLYSDITEVGKVWNKLSFIGKCVMVISLFIAFSSVATLADNIFHWKGFILDGLTFYREYIRVWIVRFIAIIPIDFKSVGLGPDELCIYGLLIGGIARIKNRRKLFRKYILEAPVLFGTYLGVGVAERYYSDTHNFGFNIPTLVIFILNLLTFTTLIIYIGSIWRAHNKPSDEPIISVEDSYRYVSVPLIAVFLVLILAAINAGLTRPV